jgi:hypothetical protein
MKLHPQRQYSPLQPNLVPFGPWNVVTINLITQLPESDGFDAIMVIVDRFSKRAHFFPITNKFSTKDLALILYD